MPDMTPSPESMPNAPRAEPEIQVIPEKFYGAALKARVPETPKPAEQQIVQPTHSKLPMILGGVILLLLIGGGVFVFLYRDTLFSKPVSQQPQVVVQTPPPPPPVQPPSAPVNLTATSTSPQSVSLTWGDASSANETGLRIERADASGAFVPLTNLPPGSSSFLDTSAQASTTYRYRVIAVNTAGEAPSSDVPVTVLAPPPAPPEAPKLPPAGLDTDSDGLTDLEEALFNSAPRNPDTDNDGFLDGNEVFHLYNPNGRAPARLLDAGLVKQYHGSIGWTMQVPNAWTVSMVTTDGSKATITTGHGESFHLSIEDNPNHLSVLDWYLQKNPTVKAEQVLEYRSKRGYGGVIGADLLTTYLPWGDKVFVFSYDLDGQPFINFRTSYAMMLNSLELEGVPQFAPSTTSVPLPFEPAATTTGVVTQPVPVVPEAAPAPTSEVTPTTTTP